MILCTSFSSLLLYYQFWSNNLILYLYTSSTLSFAIYLAIMIMGIHKAPLQVVNVELLFYHDYEQFFTQELIEQFFTQELIVLYFPIRYYYLLYYRHHCHFCYYLYFFEALLLSICFTSSLDPSFLEPSSFYLFTFQPIYPSISSFYYEHQLQKLFSKLNFFQTSYTFQIYYVSQISQSFQYNGIYYQDLFILQTVTTQSLFQVHY